MGNMGSNKMVQKTWINLPTKNPENETTAETVVVLQVESMDYVNELVDREISLGAIETHEPHKNGPMFGRSFEDPDGHVWEVFSIAEE